MRNPSLSPASVHLWHIPLSQPAIGADVEILGNAELVRAARFATPQLRDNYFNTHAAKRRILASYLNVAAKDLALDTNPYGKPCLAGASAAGDIRFNLSHTQTTVIMAVTRGREIGVDVEALDRNLTVMPLAQRYFSEPVLRHLERLEDADQRSAFLRYWTQFEAYKKARGDGLRGGDGKLTFKLAAAPDNHFQTLPFTTQPIDWQIAELDYLPEHAVAVVIEANSIALELSWQDYRPGQTEI